MPAEPLASKWGGDPVPLVLEYASQFPQGRVLDLGCGDGRNAVYLAELGFQVHAVDRSAGDLARLAERAEQAGVSERITVTCADLSSWQADGLYETVLCIQVLHFLSAPAIDRLLDEMQRHTTQGGINVVTDFMAAPPLWTEDRRWLEHDELPKRYAGWHVLRYEEPMRATTSLDSQGNAYVQPRCELVAKLEFIA